MTYAELAGFLVLFVALIVGMALTARVLFGPDRSLAAPWSPANPPAAFRDDREPPCLCGERGAARRHRYHESSRWQERGERGL